MNIEIKDIITLSDQKKYKVISKTSLKNKNFYFIIDINNPDNTKICLEDDDSLIEIDDESILKEIMIPLVNNSKEVFN